MFGTSSLGNLYQELPYSEKRALVAAWFASSAEQICVDSAGKYGAGLALETLGTAMRDLGVAPEQVLISNKLGWQRVPLVGNHPTFEGDVWKNIHHDAVQNISGEGIIACWEQGNQLLGPPYKASLLSVHDPDEYLAGATTEEDRKDRRRNILDAYRALFEIRDRGEALAVGIGCKDWRVIRELAEDISFDWVMLAGSITVHVHPPELLKWVKELHDRGTTVINSAVFNAGFLVGSEYYDYRRVSLATDRDLFTWRESFFSVCTGHGVSPADACIQFGLHQPGISSIALNTTRASRVTENIAALDAAAPAAFWEELYTRHLISVVPEVPT